MRKEKIFAFIDGQNLNLGIRNQGWILDLKKFRIYLRTKYKVTRAFYFIGYIPQNKGLYKFLRRIDYKLIFKPTLTYKRFSRLIRKGNIDAELVLHSIIKKDLYDKAIIVTGDGDFYCLFRYLLKENKLKKIIVPNQKHYSALLRKFSRYIVFVNLFKKKVELKK